jgi:hypothetical protein
LLRDIRHAGLVPASTALLRGSYGRRNKCGVAIKESLSVIDSLSIEFRNNNKAGPMKSIKDILNAAAGTAAALAKKEREALNKFKDQTLEELAKKKGPKDVIKDAAIAVGITVVMGDGLIVPILTGALADAVITHVARKIVAANKNKKAAADKKFADKKAGKPKNGPTF